MSESDKKSKDNGKKGEDNKAMNPELEELLRKRLDKSVTVDKINFDSDSLPPEKKEILDKLKNRLEK